MNKSETNNFLYLDIQEFNPIASEDNGLENVLIHTYFLVLISGAMNFVLDFDIIFSIKGVRTSHW